VRGGVLCFGDILKKSEKWLDSKYWQGLQQLKYPANIQPKPRPILKIPCLTRKYPASFNKKHTQPTQQI
jgi:hypothetical protein